MPPHSEKQLITSQTLKLQPLRPFDLTQVNVFTFCLYLSPDWCLLLLKFKQVLNDFPVPEKLCCLV